MEAPKITTTPAAVRPACEQDHSFIYHSWLKSYRASWAKGSNPVRSINKEIYYANQKEIVRYLLENSMIIVAHNPSDIHQIFGYIVAQPTNQHIGVIHYCFVKQAFRNLGIGTLLYREAQAATEHNTSYPMACTHATGLFHQVLSRRYDIMYNPYLIYMEFLNEDRRFTDSLYN